MSGNPEAKKRWAAKHPNYWNERYRSIHPVPPEKKAFCKHGHKMTESNTYHPPSNPRLNICRACVAIRGKAWALSNPEKRRENCRRALRNKPKGNYYLKKYGLTPEMYAQQAEKQNNRCAICNEEEKGKRLSVDHDHSTKKVRELLCSRCNTSIGKFSDDPELLRKAAEYLEKHRQIQELEILFEVSA